MIRSLALTASFLLAAAVPALAQTHPISHPRMHPHDQMGHTPLDSAQHAALHALLHGSWTGTLQSTQGVAEGLDLSVAHDSLHSVILDMSMHHHAHVGAASNLTLNGDTLHWTQELSNKPCQVTAVVSAAAARTPEVMNGKVACEDGERTFTLHKTTK
jgi:hypothetical protein